MGGMSDKDCTLACVKNGNVQKGKKGLKVVSSRGAKAWVGLLGAGLGLLLVSAHFHSGPFRLLPAMAGLRRANAKAEPRYTNRLAREKSPYLLQHAHNPVDWFPWGEEAFEKARREQKPIFLSVGYSTCHWCHVMEEESFSDPGIAEILNRRFVAIKADREERPDVDRVYMEFVQATTGGGGWPMSVFLTPERKPFFGGTYFPKDDHDGRPGFRTLLLRVAEAWEKDRTRILRSADEVTRKLQKFAAGEEGSSGPLQRSVLEKAYGQIQAGYDAANGGFGGAPKFPRPVVFNFLLRYYAQTGKKEALDMTLHTLRAMARGGIHDHISGGFHRYSTDATWFVPHFEKMLYDQAQLVVAYLEAYQITHDRFFAVTARDILEYVLRDMRGREGGFYSAEDADSPLEQGKPERGEGAFYAWRAGEVEKILGPEASAVFDYHFGVAVAGNVPSEQDLRGELRGKNVLMERHSVAETARHFGKSQVEVHAILTAARKKLFEARSRRPRPPLDDKVLTAWNGLMISALARASQVLEEPRYLEAAQGAAGFLRAKLYSPRTGRLKRRYRDGDAAVDGFLDDYAFLIQGLLDLYEASFNVEWLSWAVRLQEAQDELFWDGKGGGYYAAGGTDPLLLLRTREDYDGAEPSPNSVAAMNLLRLAQVTDRQDWKKEAQRTVAVFAQRLENSPEAMPQMVVALAFSLSKPKQIVIAGQPGAPDTRALLRLVHERFLPNKILLLADGGVGQKQLTRWLAFLQGVTRKQGRATAYICEDYVCKLPTSDPQTVARLLDGKP